MPGGLTERQDRQDREVFQRNMKSRMETFKSSRHKRHKKERSLKKVNKGCHDSGTHTSNTHTHLQTRPGQRKLYTFTITACWKGTLFILYILPVSSYSGVGLTAKTMEMTNPDETSAGTIKVSIRHILQILPIRG